MSKKLTVESIRAYGPCYDPTKYLPESWQGTVVDLLDRKEVPFPDRLWVLMRPDLLSDKLMRLFSVWCARQVVTEKANPLSIEALDVAEAYAEYYDDVNDPDYHVAWEEERSAAESAAWGAASSAARSVAWGAAESAARSAAESAAYAAAYAARSAAWGAASSAAYAARSAAEYAARSAQEAKLREMLVAGMETGDVK